MTDISTAPARSGADYSDAEKETLWRLAGLYAGDFDAEAERIATELGRTPSAIVKAYYVHVHAEWLIVNAVSTATLARIVADRVARR